MRVLITGAGGFMGPHLTRYLHEKECDILASYYGPGSDVESLNRFGHAIELDVRDRSSFMHLMKEFRPEKIFHLAAQSYPTVSWKEPNYTMQANVEGTINLFETLKELALNPAVIVACSSAEYGLVEPDEVPVKETHPLLPLHPYGVSKVAQDFLTYQYFKNFNLRGIRVRIFNTTGPGKINDVCSDFTKQAVLIKNGMQEPVFKVGNLNTRRAITDVRDIINALYMLSQTGRYGEVYNASGGEAYLVKEILEAVIKISGINVEIRMDPELLRPSDEPIIFGDSTRLKKDTEWKQSIPIEKTLKDMMDFWHSTLLERKHI
jgi:GDP-4-dehydro-6-deoxy-D-mannose reductase